VITVCKVVLALAALHSVQPFSLVQVPAAHAYFTFALFQVVPPFSVVLVTVFILVHSLTLPPSLFEFSLVGISVDPAVRTFVMRLVLLPVALVTISILKGCFPSAPFLSFDELSAIGDGLGRQVAFSCQLALFPDSFHLFFTVVVKCAFSVSQVVGEMTFVGSSISIVFDALTLLVVVLPHALISTAFPIIKHPFA
jgi:hypothetical protein